MIDSTITFCQRCNESLFLRDAIVVPVGVSADTILLRLCPACAARHHHSQRGRGVRSSARRLLWVCAVALIVSLFLFSGFAQRFFLRDLAVGAAAYSLIALLLSTGRSRKY